MDHLIKEAIDIRLHTNNINQEDGFSLSSAWKSLIQSLKERQKQMFSRIGIVLPSVSTTILPVPI
jgi:hypothetical protein